MKYFKLYFGLASGFLSSRWLKLESILVKQKSEESISSDEWERLYYSTLFSEAFSMLGSFHYNKIIGGALTLLAELDRIKEVSIMLDSGAFTVWTLGEEIDIVKYIEYILKLKRLYDLGDRLSIVNLDVIPDLTLRGVALKEEIDRSVIQSCLNFRRIKEAGISNVIAVHHLGESGDHLKMILDEGVEYLGLGGVARRTGKAKDERLWFNQTFNYLNNIGFRGKVHGFGITAESMVRDYPWDSVDSVSYFKGTGLGSVYIFDEKKARLRQFQVSELGDRVGGIYDKDREWILSRTKVGFDRSWDQLKNYWVRQLVSFKNWSAFAEWRSGDEAMVINKGGFIEQTGLGF